MCEPWSPSVTDHNWTPQIIDQANLTSYVKSQVNIFKQNIKRDTFSLEILNAIPYILSGYKQFANIDQNQKEFDFNSTNFSPDSINFKIIHTAFPNLETISIDASYPHLFYIFIELNNFKKLKSLNIKPRGSISEIADPLCKIRNLSINMIESPTQTTRVILERICNFTSLTFTEGYIDDKIISIIKYEKILHFKARNINMNKEECYEKFAKFLKNGKFKTLELLQVSIGDRRFGNLIKNYIEKNPQKNLKELTFSLPRTPLNLDEFLKLENLNKIKIYYCLYIDQDPEKSIVPILKAFPTIQIELIEYFYTELLTTEYLIKNNADYHSKYRKLWRSIGEVDPNLGHSYIVNPFRTLSYIDNIHSENLKNYPPQDLRNRSISIDSNDSTIPIDITISDQDTSESELEQDN